MELNINTASMEAAIARLGELKEDAVGALRTTQRTGLSGSYSSVSGLDQLGRTHGELLNGMPGSAAEVLKSYYSHIEWLGEQLQWNLRLVTEQDEEAVAALPLLTMANPLAANREVMLAAFDAKDRFAFAFGVPTAAPAVSLAQLDADFTGTQVHQTAEAIDTWNSLSAQTTQIAAGLREVASELAAENSGDPIDAAVNRISQAADAGEVFSQNADVVSQAISNVAAIHAKNKAVVSTAHGAIQMILDPAERLAAEKSFLTAFHAGFAPQIITGKPTTSNLMLPVDISSHESATLGMDESVAAQRLGTAGLNPQGMMSAAQSAGSALGQGGSLGSVSQAAGQLEQVGLDPATQAAAVGTASPQSGNGIAGLGGGFPGIGTTAVGTAGMPAGGFPGVAPFNAAAGTGGRHSAAAGVPGFNPAQLGTSAAGVSATPGMGSAGAPGMLGGGSFARGAKTGSSVGGVGGSFTGSGAGSLGAGTGGVGGFAPGAGVGTGAGAATGASSTGAAATRGAGVGTPRMGMPMAPMMGGMGQQGQNNRGGKVKTITSAVEEDANIAALLGDRGPVVPGVIGSWVRG